MSRVRTRRLFRQVVVAALAVCCCRSTPSDRRLSQDAYVWQRDWTPAVIRALHDTAPLVGGFRILVAEWSPDGRIAHAAIDWLSLQHTGRPITAVLRIDGSGALPPPAGVAAAIPSGHGLGGIEIDFDCATRRLPEYRRFLLALRPLLPPGTRLGITVLPDWLRSDALRPLTRAVDQPVLQLHATDDPRDGLFSPRLVRDRVARMARLSATPFLVSLPTYGVRVLIGPDGRLRATEAERPAMIGAAGQELFASPDQVARVVAALERDPPFRLAGLVWFRMPVESDHRSWSPASWRAVLARRPAMATAVLERQLGEPVILRLANQADLDAPLPGRIPLDPGCAAADAAGPYRREGSELVRNDGSMLPGRSTLVVGWERCPDGTGKAVPP